LKYLRLNKDIILRGGGGERERDRGKCILVLVESKYKNKFNTLLEFGVYELLPKDHTAMMERRVKKKHLSRHKTALPTDPKHKLSFLHVSRTARSEQ
jgi:hypothetical protein